MSAFRAEIDTKIRAEITETLEPFFYGTEEEFSALIDTAYSQFTLDLSQLDKIVARPDSPPPAKEGCGATTAPSPG